MNLNIGQESIFPIMGTGFHPYDFASVNLDKKHLEKLQINDDSSLSAYLDTCHQEKKAVWLTGGYLEQRSLYKSDLFGKGTEDIRDIHLGVDIWGPVGANIYNPLEGTIHSFAFNNNHLDYGYTLIIEHFHGADHFHTLYGHLGRTHFDTWQSGDYVCAGDLIADIGGPEENGGWLPHLHFQVIINLEGHNGDYPGVCSLSRIDHFKENCPDPNPLIKKSP